MKFICYLFIRLFYEIKYFFKSEKKKYIPPRQYQINKNNEAAKRLGNIITTAQISKPMHIPKQHTYLTYINQNKQAKQLKKQP